jgi:hypothetical protein
MSKGIDRFAIEYDPHVRCCCSIETHRNGQYVRYTDYIALLREYRDYIQRREQADADRELQAWMRIPANNPEAA